MQTSDLFAHGADAPTPKRTPRKPAKPRKPAPLRPWPNPDSPPEPWPDPANPPAPFAPIPKARALALIPAPATPLAQMLLPAPSAPCPIAEAIGKRPTTWPPARPQPFPPSDLALTVRQLAARKAAANRDSFAAARKAAYTRAVNRAEAAGPPPFTDYVSDRIGTRRWTVGPVPQRSRSLFDRILSPAWLAALQDAYRAAFP